MEFPWPKWMEFVVLGISVVLGLAALYSVSRFQDRRRSQSIGQAEKQNEQEEPLWTEKAA